MSEKVFVFDKFNWYDAKEGFKGKLMTKEETEKEIEDRKYVIYPTEQCTDPLCNSIWKKIDKEKNE